ncbi:MAG: glycosyltransferase family 4 protein [Patescibacteria group bacterium]|nr:glycosyltransferase family 4 protein [Patescibacteria group bacterium]
MRVAEIVCVFFPYKGGIGNVALDNAKILRKYNNDVVVFTPYHREINKKFDKKIQVKKLLPVLKYGNAAVLISLFWRLKNFDIVHLHFPFFGSVEIIWLMKKFKILKAKLIITYHMDATAGGWLGKIFKFHAKYLTPIILKSADKIIVSSFDYLKNSNIKNLFEKYPDKFIKIPFGVDLNRFRPREKPIELIKEYNIQKDEKIILFVGGLDKAHYFKGIDNLIKVFSKLQFFNCRLIIVGKGNMKLKYEQEVFDFGLTDKVIFADKVNNYDLCKFYNLADVFVLPSINKAEAFGVVLLEAMASGIPVIASNLAGVRSVVRNGVNGFLAESNNVDELVKKISLLLANNEKAKIMGVNGRKIAKSAYNKEKIDKMLIKVFEDIS